MTERIAWEGGEVAAAWHHPARGSTYLVLAHGAGGNIHTPSLKRFAESLAARGVGAVRFNFGYAEAKRKAPDRPVALEACYRAVAEQVAAKADRLFLGGRSMGGRIASHIVAAGTPCARLVFLAYPLHPPGKPERLRDEHLADVKAPMLFLQGTRDSFARWDLLGAVLARLPNATLHAVEGADHGHKVPGRAPEAINEELVDATAEWISRLG